MLITLLNLIMTSELSKTDSIIPTNAAGILPAAPYPSLSPLAVGPKIRAKAALVLDLESGKILYSQNPNLSLPPASLVKLLTAKIILDHHKLSEVVTIPASVTKIEPSKAYLLTNETITVGDLLQAILIKSANDAALALAAHHAGSPEAFAKIMNQYAQKYELNDSNFVNPHGFDHPDQYSSAADIAKLARILYRDQFVRSSILLKEKTIASTDGKITHELINTNQLLDSYLKVLGFKTGTTDEAGPCFISVIENAQGRRIITVLFNSPDRFNETKLLAEWTFQNTSWI